MTARHNNNRDQDPTWRQIGVGQAITRKCDYGNHNSGEGEGWQRWQKVLSICPACVQYRAQGRAVIDAAEAAA